MTKIEKQIITIALREYIKRHSERRSELEQDDHVNCMIAQAVLSYWKDIENAAAGSIKI